jgi:hypothetical protein
MEAVKTPECNLTYKLPGGTRDNDLPCMRTITGWFIEHPIHGTRSVEKGGMYPVMDATGKVEHVEARAATTITSFWEMDTDELAAVMQSHQVRLTVWGEPVPPVALAVIAPEGSNLSQDEWEPPVARPHLKRAISKLVERLREDGFDPASAEDVMSGLEECLLLTAGGEDPT